MTPEAQAFYPGPNRYPFTIAEKLESTGKTGKEVTDAEAAIYYAKVPRGKARRRIEIGQQGDGAEGAGAGARPAGDRPLPGAHRIAGDEAAFQGRTTTEDPDVASVIYATELDLPGDGE